LLKKCANSGTFSVKFEILVSIRLANHRAKPVLVRLSRNGLGGATVAVIEIIATIRTSMRIDFLKNLQEVSVFCLFRLCKFFLTWEYLDMAYITKTSAGTWRAEVRSVRLGHKPVRQVRTFDTKREAQAWADAVDESLKQLRKSGRIMPTAITLAQAIRLWREETRQHLERCMQARPDEPKYQSLYQRFVKDKSRAKLWSDGPFGNVALRDIGQLEVEAFIDDRREEDKADSTIANDLNLLSRLFKHAAATTSTYLAPGWRWQIDDPVGPATAARKIGQSRQRDRRLGQGELGALDTLLQAIAKAQSDAPEATCD